MPTGKDSILTPELLKRIAFTQRVASFVVLGDVLRAIERLGPHDQLFVLTTALALVSDDDK